MVTEAPVKTTRAQSLKNQFGTQASSGMAAVQRMRALLVQDAECDALCAQWMPGYQPAAPQTDQTERESRLDAVSRLGYYSLVVLLTAWTFCRRLPSDNSRPLPALQDLYTGSAFLEYGIENLGLEQLTVWFAGDAEVTAWADHAQHALTDIFEDDSEPEDMFRLLYEDLITSEIRHIMGEHYTPVWLVRHVLDGIGYFGDHQAALIDPTCGSGAFLVEALARQLRVGSEMNPGKIEGMDMNPLAVLTARVNYLCALNRLPEKQSFHIPVRLGDVLPPEEEGLWSAPTGDIRQFDYVVGNPPWINWESIDAETRRQTMHLWKTYGLFVHSGMDAILGKGKKDLSMLITLASADQYLKPNGKMVFLITQSALKSQGAADGFRRFKLPDGKGLRVIKAEDMTGLKPFESANNRTAILYMIKGSETTYPLPYIYWNKSAAGMEPIELCAEPVDPGDITSPWMTLPAESRGIVRKITGVSGYRAHEGVNTGGANGVYWVKILARSGSGLIQIHNLPETSKRQIPEVETEIEEGLLYPLIRASDLKRWHAIPSGHIILAQDPYKRKGITEGIMQRNYPRTLEYLTRFENQLRERAAYKRYYRDADPFYSMFDVGEYSLAPIKVIWQRFGSDMKAAVVEGAGKPVVCQETVVQVSAASADEAWYLAGMLNSRVVGWTITAYSMAGGKSFAGPNLLRYVRIPQFEANSAQMAIASAARAAAASVKKEYDLDTAVAAYYQITEQELALIEEGRTLRKT